MSSHDERDAKKGNPMICTTCDRALEYVGRKRFHEGTRWGFFGGLGELFVNRERFDGPVDLLEVRARYPSS